MEETARPSPESERWQARRSVPREGKTVWSKTRPLPVRQALPVCVNPGALGESYPVEKTSRGMLGCSFVVMAAFCPGSFFLRMLVAS
ncbi:MULTISPECIES: hypothetical protein [Amycolatopsis]|uniref:Uncharacterized protein n=1 Tax=Amycolatopsis dendrobii TaxID=2760662 RepID=A0A7W3VSA1_9PSEU|nr:MULTISPECIES: hypothetical protein [Amycolatopsis]MBB1152165.1 hypothetical protein [Amycolatopsis dendrobii]UKD57560.1 hypothetical protein L3Q65_12810 [Amycolatopsis sp. FU40]